MKINALFISKSVCLHGVGSASSLEPLLDTVSGAGTGGDVGTEIERSQFDRVLECRLNRKSFDAFANP